MSDRTIRPVFISALIAFALCASAPRARAAENLCDPSFQNCRDQLISLIRSELMGIDVAFWFMEDQRYTTEIIKKWKAGVPVRVIVDPRANPTYPLNVQRLGELQSAGIPMIKKTGGGIMHWKTMIFAGQHTVEFGSANYSDNAFVPVAPYTNYVSETVFYTDDPALVNSFKKKYDDLWTDTTNYSVYANVSGTRVRTYDATLTISPDLNFPPGQSFASRVIALVKAETQKIDVHMYRITQQAHSDALIAAHQRGIPIRYLTETREYHDTNTSHDTLKSAWVSWNMDYMYGKGIPMRVRNLSGEYHEKLVLLYNQATTVFGSSNFTSASDNSQQEHNYFTKKNWIFQWFEDQFNRMWNNAHGEAETKPFVPLPPDTPKYCSIADGTTGVATTGQKLVWYGGPWAHFYDIYLNTSPTFTTTPFATTPTPPLPGKPPVPNPSHGISQTPCSSSPSSQLLQSFVVPDGTLQPGTTYYWKIVSRTGANLAKTGPVWSFTTAGSGGGGGGGGGGGSVPAPWTDKDVGSVGVAGSAQSADGSAFTVQATGSDIWGSADAFNYVYQSLSTDGSIVARVASLTNTNSWAKAGVMIRATLDANSAHAFMLLSAANGVSFIRRTAAGNTSVSTTTSGIMAPRWVRLDRSGDTLTAYQSSDGTNWTRVGTDTISLGQSPLVGLAVTSHNNTTPTTATFDHVSVSNGGGGGGGGGGLPAPWLERDIGAAGLAGSAQDANGTMTVKASGADIWGSADAFHYVYQPLTRDGSFIAHLASLTNTNAWAKAGVMIRATLDPGSVHAFALVSAGSGVSFIRRTTTNGTSVSTTTSGIAPPRWIRLDRSGSTVIAYQSSDGTTWTQMGTVTLSLGQSPYIGFAVTSHNNAALTTAMFDMGNGACQGCWDY